MADGLTTPRKLEQINWRHGITDGDIRAGFFKDMLNVDMDEGGRLRTRDGLDEVESSSPLQRSRFFHLQGDPSSNHENGWDMLIAEDIVYLFPHGDSYNGSSSISFDIEFDMDVDTIEVAFVGASIYIASQTNGSPNTVISITWIETDGKFSVPEYITSGDVGGLYCQVEETGSWSMTPLDTSPVLTVHETVATGYSKADRSSALQGITSAIEDDSEHSVALYFEHQRKDTSDEREFGFTEKAVIDVVVVFVYADGSLSVPSKSVQVNWDFNDTDFTFDIGVSIFVSKDISKSVSQVRVYRKIKAGSAVPSIGHEYLMSAVIFDTEIHEDTGLISIIDGFERHVHPVDPGGACPSDALIDDYVWIENEANHGFMNDLNGAGFTQDGTAPGTRITYAHKIADNLGRAVPYSLTAGWIKPIQSSDIRMFMPPHYCSEGVLNFKCGLTETQYESGNEYVSITTAYDDSVKVTDRFNIINESDSACNSTFSFVDAIIAGSRMMKPHAVGLVLNGTLSVGMLSPNSTLNTLTDVSITPGSIGLDLLGGRGVFRLGDDAGAFYYSKDPSSEQYNTTGDRHNEAEGFCTTFVMFRDSANIISLPSLEDEFGGTDIDSLLDVKPKHIGVAGGRLFGLNVHESGHVDPSKLVYSEFGKYSSFRKDNYIDYGVRDDGHGVAISAIKSYVIVHNTNSTYVFDISGGSDFNWREVGAYADVGCLGNELICITPFGVFWCDRSAVWSYGGNRPVSISDEIKTTYVANVDTARRLEYREDLKQVWLTFGSPEEVLVYDLMTQAWHRHVLEETDNIDYNINSIFTVGSKSFINVSNNGYQYNKLFEFNRNSSAQFAWGVDTGSMSMNIPEVVKKIRRMYINTIVDEGYSVPVTISITASGDKSGEVTINGPLVTGGQLRLSASIRGYFVAFKLMIDRSTFWRGSLDSLGASYKQKKLK